VCLIVTAFVVAPVGIAWQGGNAAALLKSFAPFEYVSSNMAVWVFQRDIGGTPANVPHEGTWNGSLWTLGWEALCYVGVLVLGLAGLLRRRWVLPSTFGAVWIVLVASALLALPGHLENGARFGIMFLAGAVIFQYQDSIRCSWALVGAAVAITAGSMFLTDYRLVGAIFWAYAVICAGALIKVERLRLREDLSYGAYIYAFPIQQLLVIAVGPLTPLLFAVVATAVTLPIAAMSWFAVEKPTLRLKNRLDRESVRNRVPST
jgi:peptidoglycan/LPS O-acetylase OafA/YrhL